MRAELIAIGSELLLGEIIDTNSAHLAQKLRTIGLSVERFSAIGDDVAAIARLVQEASARAAVVITTGGLGPTVDDPTREAVARTPTENNRRQAYVPAGAIPLENPVGTAPCFIVEHAQGVVICLPGVPREMEHMLETRVLPYVRERFNLRGVIKAKLLRTVGIGESMIDAEIGELEKLTNPTVGLNAHAGAVDVRITAKAESEAEADALIAPVAAQVREKLGDYIYAEEKIALEEAVLQMLAMRGLTLTIAEDGTRGALNAKLALLPQAAQVYRGASVLNASPLTEEAARLRSERSADLALALRVTATPEEKRIETALASANDIKTHTQTYGGALTNLAQWAVTVALNQIRIRLARQEPL